MKSLQRQIITFLLCLFLVFPVRIVYVLIVFYRTPVAKKNVKRGEILDADGLVLASSMRTYSVYYLPHERIDSKAKIAKDLSGILNCKRRPLKKRLNLYSKFVWMARHISPEKANKISQLGYPGIYVIKDRIRFYPYSDLFFHVVGKVDIDNDGLIGVERVYNDRLLSKASRPLKLSLKVAFQHVLKEELLNGKSKFQANFVSGIIASAEDGKILAMFSSNTEKALNPHSKDDVNDFNIAMQGRYELGSILKVFSAALFLEKNIVNLEEVIAVPPNYRIGSFKIMDYGRKHEDFLYLSFKDCFVVSSNIAFVKISSERTSYEDHLLHYAKLGIWESWNLDRILINKSIKPKKMRKCDLDVFSYGYGVSLSLITYLRGFLRIVTGKNMSLHIESDYVRSCAEDEKIFSDETVSNVRKLLCVSAQGKAMGCDFGGVRVGGKTGTAKKHVAKGYDATKNLSSYVFVYPIDNPKIIGIILIDEPSLNGVSLYGAQSAMLIAFKIIEKLIKLSVDTKK